MRTIDPASRAEALTNLKSATHRYHKLVIAAKQKYYSSLIHSSSSNPRHLWIAVNCLLHRKSPSPLPSSIPSPSIADTFCSFFSDKIFSLRFTLQSLLKMHKIILYLRNSTRCLYGQGAFLGHFSNMHNDLEIMNKTFKISLAVFLKREKQKRT